MTDNREGHGGGDFEFEFGDVNSRSLYCVNVAGHEESRSSDASEQHGWEDDGCEIEKYVEETMKESSVWAPNEMAAIKIREHSFQCEASFSMRLVTDDCETPKQNE